MLPILMYHEVALPGQLAALERKIQSSYVVTTEQFSLHLDRLRAIGANSVTPSQVSDWLAGKGELPSRAVLITFDDGFRGNFEHALPALEAYGFTAVFFVTTNKIGDDLMMSWQELLQLSKRGMSIQSHTATHPLLSTLTRQETEDEFRISKREIESRLGTSVTLFSLPNGDTNPWFPKLAEELGYIAGCGSRFGRNRRTDDRFELKRIAIKRSTTAHLVAALVMGKRTVYARASAIATAKWLVRRVLSKRVYDRLYNRFFGIDEQRKGAVP